MITFIYFNFVLNIKPLVAIIMTLNSAFLNVFSINQNIPRQFKAK
jgi:hypothetical protein